MLWFLMFDILNVVSLVSNLQIFMLYVGSLIIVGYFFLSMVYFSKKWEFLKSGPDPSKRYTHYLGKLTDKPYLIGGFALTALTIALGREGYINFSVILSLAFISASISSFTIRDETRRIYFKLTELFSEISLMLIVLSLIFVNQNVGLVSIVTLSVMSYLGLDHWYKNLSIKKTR